MQELSLASVCALSVPVALGRFALKRITLLAFTASKKGAWTCCRVSLADNKLCTQRRVYGNHLPITATTNLCLCPGRRRVKGGVQGS